VYVADFDGQGVVDCRPTEVRLDTQPAAKLQRRYEEIRVHCQRLQERKSTNCKK